MDHPYTVGPTLICILYAFRQSIECRMGGCTLPFIHGINIGCAVTWNHEWFEMNIHANNSSSSNDDDDETRRRRRVSTYNITCFGLATLFLQINVPDNLVIIR